MQAISAKEQIPTLIFIGGNLPYKMAYISHFAQKTLLRKRFIPNSIYMRLVYCSQHSVSLSSTNLMQSIIIYKELLEINKEKSFYVSNEQRR